MGLFIYDIIEESFISYTCFIDPTLIHDEDVNMMLKMLFADNDQILIFPWFLLLGKSICLNA